jgi:hypothetical protein
MTVSQRYSDEPRCKCLHVKVVHRGVQHIGVCAAMRWDGDGKVDYCLCAAFSGASASAGEPVAGAPVRADMRAASPNPQPPSPGSEPSSDSPAQPTTRDDPATAAHP